MTKTLNFTFTTEEWRPMLNGLIEQCRQRYRSHAEYESRERAHLHYPELELAVRFELANIHGRYDTDSLESDLQSMVDDLHEWHELHNKAIPDWLDHAHSLSPHLTHD